MESLESDTDNNGREHRGSCSSIEDSLSELHSASSNSSLAGLTNGRDYADGRSKRFSLDSNSSLDDSCLTALQEATLASQEHQKRYSKR